MRLIYFFAITVCLTVSSTPISAHFLPDLTSIPSWLNDTRGAWDSFRNLSGCHPARKADGLSKLKNYLQHFGYITNILVELHR
ncbi:hypothetical protein SLA2020_359400 [Shorea laevis]